MKTFEQLAPSALDDETGWLEQSAESIRNQRFNEVETEVLAEFLSDNGEARSAGSVQPPLSHAEAVYGDAYSEARLQAADETGLEFDAFPLVNPWSLEAALEDLAL